MMLLGALSALLIAALSAAAICACLLLGRARYRAPRHGPEARAALRRHPAGRNRRDEFDGLLAYADPGDGPPMGPGRAAGPDDDPEFIKSLERLIRGEDGDSR
jgi:hypothetical protein